MLNGIFNIGQSALNAAQAWISVTGNNIANADTEGYSRQYVDQRDAGGINYNPGEQGLGVKAQQILRFYDAFLTSAYVAQSTNSSRWEEHETIMAALENIFNESNREGINSLLNEFFGAWQDLSLRPDDIATRKSLISFADGLSDMVGNSMDSIRDIQREMDVSIAEDVSRVNELSKAIADINKQITANTLEGMSNPNSLLDERDRLVKEMATMMDVETIDNGRGEYRVQLTTGQPLVDGYVSYEVRVMGPRNENRPMPDSTYKGSVIVDGQDSHEYTVEIVRGGTAPGVGSTAEPPQFRVSLDGGKTWLRDTEGKEMRFDITNKNNIDLDNDGNIDTDAVLVKNLKISFSSLTDFNVGDKFDIIPKDGLYWIEPTKGPENITPQIDFNGTDNPHRLTGGTLTAYYNIRDDNCGRYMDELNAVMSSLIWEVNRIHTQGTGLDHLTYLQGDQLIEAYDQPLGSAQAVLPFSGRLQEGNVNFHFYDSVTGDYLESTMLNFNTNINDVRVENFNPAVHTLEDVRDAINRMTLEDGSNPLKASIQADRLIIETNMNGINFAMGADTCGLMAALGLNTFFSGHDADTLAVNTQVHTNENLVAAGQVNGQFQTNVGDNISALQIGALSDKDVVITTFWRTVDDQSISEYYANLVTTVGADTRRSNTNAEYHGTLTADLEERVASVSGVNMDEEMSNLIKYQHSYTAAAKMITTADQMLQTLLGLKQ